MMPPKPTAIDTLAARVANSNEPAWRLVLKRIRDSNAQDIAASLLPIADALDDAKRASEAFKTATTNGAPASSVAVVNGAPSAVPRVNAAKDATSTARGVSFTAPRGKFDVHAMRDGGIVLENAKNQFVLSQEDVRRVLELPTGDANDTRFVVVGLNGDGIVNGKSRCKTLCATFRAKDKLICEGKMSDEVKENAEGEPMHAAEGMFKVLKATCGADKCGSTDPARVFAGSKGTGAVQATKGFNSGYLFFLKEGVAFGQSPAMYVHFDDLEDLRVLRAENAGSSSFDLAMTPEDGATIEFSNISREELDHVSRYLAKRCTSADDAKAAMENDDTDGRGASAADLLDEDEDDSSDEDDEDFDGRESDEESDDDDDDDSDSEENNDMEYSHDNSDEVHGDDEDAEHADVSTDDGDGNKRRRVDATTTTTVIATAKSNVAISDDDDDSDSDDNAFAVVGN